MAVEPEYSLRWSRLDGRARCDESGALNFNGGTRQLVALGGLLTAVAPFLAWERVILLGSLDLFNLVSASDASPLWALVVPAIGLAAILVAGMASDLTTVRSMGLALGLI